MVDENDPVTQVLIPVNPELMLQVKSIPAKLVKYKRNLILAIYGIITAICDLKKAPYQAGTPWPCDGSHGQKEFETGQPENVFWFL
jgi:hypothetical protein